MWGFAAIRGSRESRPNRGDECHQPRRFASPELWDHCEYDHASVHHNLSGRNAAGQHRVRGRDTGSRSAVAWRAGVQAHTAQADRHARESLLLRRRRGRRLSNRGIGRVAILRHARSVRKYKSQFRICGSRIGAVASPPISSQVVSPANLVHRLKPFRSLSRLVAFWHLASLDAPTVAVVWALAIARSAHVRLEPWVIFLLAGVTLTVYALDRLLDARRAIRTHALETLRERHHFHWRHRRLLLLLTFCTGVTAIALIFRLMPVVTREHDSIIAAAALAYFSGVHAPARFPQGIRRLGSKEMLVSILFVAGCAAPTLARLPSHPSIWALDLALAFLVLLAWLNCAAISIWESQGAGTNVEATAEALALAGLAVSMVLPYTLQSTAALVGSSALGALLLLILHSLRNRLSPVVLRALADFVLLTPAVLLIPGTLPG